MLRLWKRSRARAVEFSERTGAICDAACRMNAIVEREQNQVLLWAVRPPR